MKPTCATWAVRLIGVRGMKLDEKDYIVGMATTPKDPKKAEAELAKAKAAAGVPEATANRRRPFRSKAR